MASGKGVASADQITRILADIRNGDKAASNELIEAVYSDLRRMAHGIFASERPDHTLQPTALVHEAWLRIFSGAEVDWRGRSHFYAVAACQMRRILVDHAREFRAAKRGNGLKVVLDENQASPSKACEIAEVDELLDRLERSDPEAAEVVEMKFFAGMTDEEVAAELGCSRSGVRRHWAFAKAWLVRQMTDSPGNLKS
jgi:RNA polymerase sigma factor (TIGR02999 family)